MSRDTDAATAHSMPITEKPASDKKVSARPPLDFYARLHNKEITVKTIAGPQITGTLRAFSPYDLLIEIDGGNQIILAKHAILFTTGPSLKRQPEVA